VLIHRVLTAVISSNAARAFRVPELGCQEHNGRNAVLPDHTSGVFGMSRGFPSMTALLGLLAVAGYQNRDKISEMLRGAGGAGQAPGGASAPGQSGGLGGVLDQLRGSLAGGSGSGAGGFLSGGLSELIDRFKQNGQGDTVDSWVGTGPNKQIAPPQLEHAIGADVLDALSQQTGLSKQELVARLSRELPDAVDKYTPQGRLPSAA
jgi:uncharacterized protein YidB (DUF937 family)